MCASFVGKGLAQLDTYNTLSDRAGHLRMSSSAAVQFESKITRGHI